MIDLNLDIDKFVLQDDYFENQSSLHGKNHTYRVMCHCLYLGDRLNNVQDTRRALCAAFIHDMSRRHDGYCTDHGAWAITEKLPAFTDLFLLLGLSEVDIQAIAVAVENHSAGYELETDDPFYISTAILKDADALDRFRLGSRNLNPEFLRFEESHELIPFARELYMKTRNLEFERFTSMLDLASKF